MKLLPLKLSRISRAQINRGMAIILCTAPVFLNPASLHGQTAVNAGSVNVCPAGKSAPTPCSADRTVTFSIPAGTTIGKIAILTTGVADLDFRARAGDTSTTLCKAKTYSSAATCTVDVTFAPLAPGLRRGAVELLDGTTVVALTYIYGTGVGPAIAFSPSPLQTVLAALPNSVANSVVSLTVDASGNIFILTYNFGAPTVPGVTEFLASDGYATAKTLYTGNAPEVFFGKIIVVDGAGNVFFAGNLTDSSGAGIVELVAARNYAAETVGGTAVGDLIAIDGLAIDGSGNLFVLNGDTGVGAVDEVLAAGSYTTVKPLFSGTSSLNGLALDADANVYVADGYLAGSVKEVLAASGYTTVKVLNDTLSDLDDATLLGVDAANNVYLDSTNGRGFDVFELMAAGGYATGNVIYSPSVPFSPRFVTSDELGNFYQYPVTSIVRVARSQPPALAFAATNVGSTSSDSPQSATVENTGNATLTGSFSLTDSADFPLVAGSGTPADCASSFSLASGVDCALNIDFTPQSVGNLTASVDLTDNSGNASAATQSIALSGTGASETVAQVSPTSLQFGSIPYGGTLIKVLTISNVGGGTLTVDPSSNGPSVVISENAGNCAFGVAGGKSCALYIEFNPARLGPHTNTLTIATNTAVNLKVPTSGYATGVGSLSTSLDFGTVNGRGNTKTAALTVTNYGVSGSVTVATSTGAVSFKVISNTCTTGITAGNGCNIGVEYAPTAQGTQTANLKLIPSTGPAQEIRLTGTLVP